MPDIVLLKNLIEWDLSVTLFEHVGSLYYPLRLRPRVYCTPHTHVPLLCAGLGPGYLVYSCTVLMVQQAVDSLVWGEVVRWCSNVNTDTLDYTQSG